mgnify:FL=1
MSSYFIYLISDTQLTQLLVILAVAVFALIIVGMVLNNHENTNVKKKFELAENTTRIICIDAKNNKVRYFNKSNIEHQVVCTLEEFLNNFPTEEKVRFEKWIDELLSTKKNVSDYLEVDVIFEREKKSYYSFIQLQKIDKKKKIIHLESYVMKYLDVKNKTDKKKISNITVTNIEQMLTIEKMKNKNKGSFLFVAFRNTKIQDEDDDKVSSLFFVCAKNIIAPYLTSNCTIADYSQSSFTIYYPGISSRKNLLRLMHSISKTISKYLKINSFNEDYNYSVTGTLINEENCTYKQLVRNAKSISVTAMDHNDHIMIYDDNSVSSSEITTSYENEFNTLITKKDFKILYQPIINIKTGSILAYNSTIKCNNTIFSNIQELKEYAYKVGKIKDLFTMFNKKILSRYLNENISNVKLIYNVSVLEREHIAKSFSHISGIDSEDIILSFSELEISEWLSEEEEIISSIANLKEHGYKVALKIDKKELLLTNELMKIFDYFILDSELIKDCRKSGRSILIIHTLIDTLKSYDKNIIAYGLDTNNSMYLICKMGIKYVSSNLISQADEMILPIEKKKLSKVMALVNGKK